MAPLEELTNACWRAEDYPLNTICTRTREHTLKSLKEQLSRRKPQLFCSSADAAIDFLELRRSEEGYQNVPMVSCGAIQQHMEANFANRRPDPRRRFVFIEAPHSRDPLRVTFHMFTYLASYLQLMPAFVELLSPFGQQHYTRDFNFSGIHIENRLTEAERGLRIDVMNRSGIQTEMCYGLKSVERTPDHNPWSIRHCSIYHRYDLITQQTTWLVVKGNSLMRELIESHLRKEKLGDVLTYLSDDSTLRVNMDTHALIAAWSSENWQWYIGDLETSFQTLTRGLLTFSPKKGPPNMRPTPEAPLMPTPQRRWTLRSMSTFRTLTNNTIQEKTPIIRTSTKPWQEKEDIPGVRPFDDFSIQDLTKIQSIQEKVTEVIHVLATNVSILERLDANYKSMFARQPEHVVFHESVGAAAERFHQDMGDALARLSMQKDRAEALLSLINERKSILNAIVQYKSTEASNTAAQKAQVSSERMEDMTAAMHEIARKTKAETVSMRIITLVTLFFLPGTFISTLMSTPIVSFDNNPTDFSRDNIGFGALKLYVLISVPLVVLTFAAWAIVYRREKRGEQLRSVSNTSDMIV